MRHRLSRLRLRHKPAHSNSMQRNLATSLILYESIRTTKKRAQVVRPIVERLITVAKKKEPRLAIREINRVVVHENASKKMMEVLKDRFRKRQSGFTRMVPVGARHGDGAKLVTLMLLDGDEVISESSQSPP
ncbi:50S ribosomal protein L17 [Candidatus Peregrinibacteria bacterium]|nr:50S ribosomal protein L17 [Candidatus Peregrinibacteria bacterium]